MNQDYDKKGNFRTEFSSYESIQTWTNYRMKLISAHTSGINIEIGNYY